jgi:uncharacterized OB-fold protein
LTTSHSDQRPRPGPDDTSRFFWDGAGEGRLLVQRCAGCARFQHPPDVACIHCQSTDLVPTEVSGRGVLYSYAVVDRPFHVGFVDAVPYVVGLIDLDEQPGLRLLTNIVGAPADALAVGMVVEATFETRGDVSLPQFRPVGTHP